MIHRRGTEIPQIVQGRFDAGAVMTRGVDGGILLLWVVSVVVRGRAQRTPVLMVQLLLLLTALVAEREEPAAVAHAVLAVGRRDGKRVNNRCLHGANHLLLLHSFFEVLRD